MTEGSARPGSRHRLAAALRVILCALLAAPTQAQDAIIAAAHVDRLSDGDGGGASVHWIRPRANDVFLAGATFLSLPGTRWAYATFGGTRKINARTTLNAEGNLGGGNDDGGTFRYILLRGGVTEELIARRLYGEAEWLQVDVARQQDGIARLGAAFLPVPRLTLRASVYESLFGDNDTTLGAFRADYDFGRVSVLAGFSGGTAAPVLLQQAGSDATRVREAFGGVAFGAGARRWTVLLSTLSSGGEDRQRLTVSCRFPVGSAMR